MMSRLEKIHLIAVLGFSSVSILASHTYGSLFPFLVILKLLVVVSLLPFVWSNNVSWKYLLVVTVITGTLYDVWVYLFPAGLVGFDPGWYVQSIAGIHKTGHTEVITRSFYEFASGFHVLGAQFYTLTAVDLRNSLVFVPSIVTTVLVLSLTVVIRRTPLTDHSRALKLMALFALTTTVFTKHASWPFAQTLGVLLFLVLFTLLSEKIGYRMMVVASVLAMAMFVTHRIPLLIFTMIIGVYKTADFITERIGYNELLPSGWSTAVVLTFIIFLFIQYVHYTNFLPRVILRVSRLFLPESTPWSYAPPINSATSAVRPLGPLEAFIYQYGHAITLVAAAGVAWFVIAICREKTPIESYLLVSASILVTLIFVSFVAQDIGAPYRYLYFAEPILTALIVIVAAKDRYAIDNHQFAIGAVLLVILCFQVFAPASIPDSPMDGRDYLDIQELSGKEFANTYVAESVHTDPYMVLKPNVNPERTGVASGYTIYDNELVNGNFPPDFEYLLLRENVEIYSLPGNIWRLTWSPESEINARSNKVYTNSNVGIYKR